MTDEFEIELLNLIIKRRDITVTHFEMVSSEPNKEDMDEYRLIFYKNLDDIQITKDQYEMFSKYIKEIREEKINERSDESKKRDLLRRER